MKQQKNKQVVDKAPIKKNHVEKWQHNGTNTTFIVRLLLKMPPASTVLTAIQKNFALTEESCWQ